MSVHIVRHSDDGYIITVFDRKTQEWIAVATTPSRLLAEQIAKAIQRSAT